MTNNPDDLLNGKASIRWYHYIFHLGYYIPYIIRFFFSKPFKKEKKELNVLEQIQTLIESGATNENIEKCEELSHLHRIIENTKARRRLEKWSLKVIVAYLLIVLALIIVNYTLGTIFSEAPIPSTIMITILSTTTINIIGLGLIVLRGYFLSKESMESERQNKKANK